MKKVFFIVMSLIMLGSGSMVYADGSALSKEAALESVNSLMNTVSGSNVERDTQDIADLLLSDPENLMENVIYIAGNIPAKSELSDTQLLRLRDLEIAVRDRLNVIKAKADSDKKYAQIGAAIIGSVTGYVIAKRGTKDNTGGFFASSFNTAIVVLFTALGYMGGDIVGDYIASPVLDLMNEFSSVDIHKIKSEIDKTRSQIN